MTDRVAYIDNLRITVNFLIVLNHTFWNRSLEHVFNKSELEFVELLRFLSMNLSPIRVPFFFLIAGLFSAVYLKKRGLPEFVAVRFKRILIPLLFGLFTYVYLVLAISRFSDVSILWDFSEYRHYIVSGFGGFGYVWFLYVLIIYSCVLVVGYCIATSFPVFKRLIYGAADFLCRNKYNFLGVLLILEFLKFIFLVVVPKAYYQNIPFLPLEYIIHYINYFFVGILAGLCFHRFQEKIRFNLRETIALLIAYAGIGVYGYVFSHQMSFQLYSVVSNALPLVLILSLFNVFLNRRYRQLSVITNSTYTIYLIHFPIICLLSYLLVHLHIPVMMIYFIVILVAYPVSLAAALVIRRIPPAAFLFGAKPLYRFKRASI